VYIDLITMVSTVADAASVDRTSKNGEASIFRFVVHAASTATRGNRVSFPAGVGIGTRFQVHARKLK